MPVNVRNLVFKSVATVMRKDTSQKNVPNLVIGLVLCVPTVVRVSVSSLNLQHLANEDAEGHGRGRCKAPPKEEDGATDGSGANGYGNSGYDAGDSAGGYEHDASSAVADVEEGGAQW